VFDRAGRRFGDGRRHVRGALARQDHAGDTGGFSRAQDRAEVVRVGHAVERHEECMAVAQQLDELCGAQRCSDRDHALM